MSMTALQLAEYTIRRATEKDKTITNLNFDTYNSLTPNWYYKVLR